MPRRLPRPRPALPALEPLLADRQPGDGEAPGDPAGEGDGHQVGMRGIAGGNCAYTAQSYGASIQENEMADAMCEIVNIVAGDFKARVRDRANPLQMGLPVFIQGAVQATDRVRRAQPPRQ